MNYPKWWQVLSYRIYRAWRNFRYDFPFQNVARRIICVVMENRREKYAKIGQDMHVQICQYGIKLRCACQITFILWKDLPYIPKAGTWIKIFNPQREIEALEEIIKIAERNIGLP